MQYNRGECKLESASVDEKNFDEKKKSRRTKKDGQARNYNCPCGKSYLSYPALYTHVKTKHGDKPNFLEQRPIKETPLLAPKISEKSTHCPPNHLDLICNAVDQYFPNKDQTTYTSNSSQQIDHMIQLVESSHILSPSPSELGKKKQTIYQLLGRFLLYLKQRVTEQGYSYLKQWVHNLILLINLAKNDENHCSKNSCNELPLYFNDYILRQETPNIENGEKTKISQIFGCKILYYFGQWMHSEGYTNYSTKLNSIPVGRSTTRII